MEISRNSKPDVIYDKTMSTILLCIRVTIAWMYFSAFWRRVILVPAKLDPASAEYVGMKFNSFMPHAFGMQPILEFLLAHGEILIVFLIIFTIIEGLCGVGLMLGFFTRLTSFGIMCLSSGILLGAGWLGNASYDEWMVGIGGVAGAMAIFLSGGGHFSVDSVIFGDRLYDGKHKALVWFTSGKLPLLPGARKRFGLWLAIIAVFLGLFTLQVFHNGVIGKPVNYNVLPEIEIQAADISDGELKFEVYRPDGPDSYGAFIVKIELIDGSNQPLWHCDFLEAGQSGKKISGFKIDDLSISKVTTENYSMYIPLGALSTIITNDQIFSHLPVGLYNQ